MNAQPVDVLAVLDDAEQKLRLANLSYEQTIPLREARAAVAWLLEADREYDIANAAIRRDNPAGTRLSIKHPGVIRVLEAAERRAAALNRLGVQS